MGINVQMYLFKTISIISLVFNLPGKPRSPWIPVNPRGPSEPK